MAVQFSGVIRRWLRNRWRCLSPLDAGKNSRYDLPMNMKRCCTMGFAIGMSLLIVGCSDTPPPAADTRAADEKAIRDSEIAWAAEFKAKDADKLMNHYADDADLMVPNAPLAKGKVAIRSMLIALLADKSLSLTFNPTKIDVAKGGDMAYTQGAYAMTTTNPKTKKAAIEKGSYVTVYKKQADGSWKAIEDSNIAEGTGAAAVPTKSAKAPRKKAVRRKK